MTHTSLADAYFASPAGEGSFVREEDAALVKEYYERTCAADVYAVAHISELTDAPVLSERLGNTILLKREDQQPGFSFKCRGAYNRIKKLHDLGGLGGVIAASAGNHAQGVALAAQRLQLPAVIVMPITTPQIKVAAVRALGAEVELYGDDFDTALVWARDLAAARGLTFIHPFDDADTIAGQGTIGLELLRQLENRNVAALFSCVGGGGLASGVGAVMRYARPDITQFGVEAEDAACMLAALNAGKPVSLDRVGLFADGAAVRRAGDLTFQVCRAVLDAVLTVTVEEIAAAIKDVFIDTRTLIEPAGALGLAGLKKHIELTGARDQTFVAIVSGANINFDRLRHVVELTEVGIEHECLFAVTVPEQPGSFLEFCECIGRRSITEFNYRRHDATNAQVFVGVKVRKGAAECSELFGELDAAGYSVYDMTRNEAARLHVRHMIGGHPSAVVAAVEMRERLFRFSFPERPGALLAFLHAMDPGWDITLFHYRNHGAAFGRVLVGLMVPADSDAALEAFTHRLGYHCIEETDSEVYRRFLR